MRSTRATDQICSVDLRLSLCQPSPLAVTTQGLESEDLFGVSSREPETHSTTCWANKIEIFQSHILRHLTLVGKVNKSSILRGEFQLEQDNTNTNKVGPTMSAT